MSKQKKYLHDFDFVASVTTECENFHDIPPEDLRDAMLNRIRSLRSQELSEAFGHVQTTEA